MLPYIAILILSVSCTALVAITMRWMSKYDSAQATNKKLRAQVESLREIVKAVKAEADVQIKPKSSHARAVHSKLEAYMADYMDTLLSEMLPPLRAPKVPPVREVPITGAVCAAVGCGACIDFTKAHSYKVVGAYKKHSSERVLKFLCAGCKGKQVAA